MIAVPVTDTFVEPYIIGTDWPFASNTVVVDGADPEKTRDCVDPELLDIVTRLLLLSVAKRLDDGPVSDTGTVMVVAVDDPLKYIPT